MPARYYKILLHRMTFGELWQTADNTFVFLILATLKLVHWTPIVVSVPLLDEIPEVDWKELPARIRDGLRGNVEGLVDDGFEYLFCYEVPYLEPTRSGAAAVLLAPDKRTTAAVIYYRDPGATRSAVAFLSAVGADGRVATVNYRKMIDHPPESDGEWVPHLSRADAYRRHRDRLADASQVRVLDPDEVRRMTLQSERRIVEHNIDRGVFVPMTPAEVRAAEG